MKRLCLALVTLAALLAFVGCQKKELATNQDDRPTVRLVTDATGIDDKSFNAAAWRGILEFYNDTWENQSLRGKLYDVVTCQTQDMYIPTLKQVSDEGYDLIVTTGFTFADALAEVAALYPEQKYMIVDVDWVNLPNVMNFIFTEEQGSYLVGVAAALQSQAEGIENPRFGFIGGVPGATITKFEVGYIQGIRSVIPNAEVVDYYANDWGKPELAKTQAKNWYDSGVYAIFSAAGGTGNGTISQAKEYRMQGKNVWAIGVDSDQYEDGIYEGTKSAVLTSMVKRVESAAAYALIAVARDYFTGEVVNMSLHEDGVDFAASNPDLSADVVAKLTDIKANIMNGSIVVEPTYAGALAKGLVPTGLGAKDN
ncbi:MAG: BMP family ABC transporter substrate-binding protein [Treponema sp.]|nr:BMP family ABC transporter substrate-binding protein [Treponema sp.]